MQKYSPVSVVATVSLHLHHHDHSPCVLTSLADDESIPTIRCSTCSEWHHRTCVSISENKAQSFVCQRCMPVQERGESFVSLQSVPRGSDVLSSLSGDPNDSGSFRRNESPPRNSYAHRDQQDPRPISAPRSSYSGEDRNNTPQSSPHGPKPPEDKLNWGAGPTPRGPSIKPTATAPSPTTGRSSASVSTEKPKTGSLSSGTYASSSSPHTASFTEAERIRKQHESQQEQFRRAHEKLEAERQLKSARRPKSPQFSGPSVPERSTRPSTSSRGEEKRRADETEKRGEEDSRRREEAKLEGFRRKQEIQHIIDLFRDPDPSRLDSELMHEQVKVMQEAEFRKRAEEILRTRAERMRNYSSDSPWPNPSHRSNSFGTSPSMSKSPPQFSGISVPERSAGPSTSSWVEAPPWGPSIKPTATAPSPTTGRSSAGTSTGKPRTASVSSGKYLSSSSPHTAFFSEAERTRKQHEFAESQHEQFRRAQEKLEADRQLRPSGRPLSREEFQRVFGHHERLWIRLNLLNELSWNDFPWPVGEHPSNPDDMTLPQISAYVQSYYLDKDNSRTPKDSLKEHLKRWHPDRFETKLLPKVVEDEREKVKHGAGNVARYLSDLIRKENERNNNNIFGD